MRFLKIGCNCSFKINISHGVRPKVPFITKNQTTLVCTRPSLIRLPQACEHGSKCG
jgi:hypothetical protein